MGAQNNLIRRCVGKGVCRWCGRARRSVFTYRSSRSSDLRDERQIKPFCGVECFLDYSNISRRDFDYIETRRD